METPIIMPEKTPDSAPELEGTTQSIHITTNKNPTKIWEEVEDRIAEESKVTITLNDHRIVKLIATAHDLDALAVGHFFTEGYISGMEDITNLEIVENQAYISTCRSETHEVKGVEITTSGCALPELIDEIYPSIQSNWTTTPQTIIQAQEVLHVKNVIWRYTGGCHISGIFSKAGKLLYWAEDVGRHNTLDKVIGKAIIKGENLSECFLITSGRLAGEMVRKVVRAGIPMLVSNTAALSIGVETAQRAKMTLIGFVRGEFLTIYTHPWRVERV